MTRLIGLLSWYDERPEELIACVASLARMGADHIVALDGAYERYPDAEAASDPNQHAVLALTCREAGLGLTLHVPRRPWAGNEVAKRTALFGLGWAVARQRDWFVVMDADEVVHDFAPDLRQRLADSAYDAAVVTACDAVALQAQQANWPPFFAVRKFFRAQPMRAHDNHFTYVTDDDRVLWAGGDTLEGALGEWEHRPDVAAEPALDLLNHFTVLHRPQLRDAERQRKKLVYYTERDESAEELRSCACGRPALKVVARHWTITEAGPVAQYGEFCDRCAKRAERQGAKRMAALNIDPDTVRWRQGKRPEGVAS